MLQPKLYLITLFILFCATETRAQGEANSQAPDVIFSTAPLRFVYGPNLQVTGVLDNGHQVEGMLQYHFLDFHYVVDEQGWLADLLVPKLIETRGITSYFTYYFPLQEDLLYLGPRAGFKSISSSIPYRNQSGNWDSRWVDQNNLYALASLKIGRPKAGFNISGYVQVGAVYVRYSELPIAVENIEFPDFDQGVLLPHILAGFNIGFGTDL